MNENKITQSVDLLDNIKKVYGTLSVTIDFDTGIRDVEFQSNQSVKPILDVNEEPEEYHYFELMTVNPRGDFKSFLGYKHVDGESGKEKFFDVEECGVNYKTPFIQRVTKDYVRLQNKMINETERANRLQTYLKQVLPEVVTKVNPIPSQKKFREIKNQTNLPPKDCDAYRTKEVSYKAHSLNSSPTPHCGMRHNSFFYTTRKQ